MQFLLQQLMYKYTYYTSLARCSARSQRSVKLCIACSENQIACLVDYRHVHVGVQLGGGQGFCSKHTLQTRKRKAVEEEVADDNEEQEQEQEEEEEADYAEL